MSNNKVNKSKWREYAASSIVLLFAAVVPVGIAPAFPCDLVDDCSTSSYNETHYTCQNLIRCLNINRKWCGTTGKWLYLLGSYNDTPPFLCVNTECAEGSWCLSQPGGG